MNIASNCCRSGNRALQLLFSVLQILTISCRRIFGDCDDCESGPEEVVDAENERPPSMLTLLLDQQKKEIEQRKRDEEYEEARRRADQAARALQQLANNS